MSLTFTQTGIRLVLEFANSLLLMVDPIKLRALIKLLNSSVEEFRMRLTTSILKGSFRTVLAENQTLILRGRGWVQLFI